MERFEKSRLLSEEILQGIVREGGGKLFSLVEYLETSCTAKAVVCDVRKYLTMDNLWKRGIIIMNWCFRCKSHGDNVAHLFFTLCSDSGIVVFGFQLVGCFLGNACFRDRVIMLEGTFW
jgi:hypothetical protein